MSIELNLDQKLCVNLAKKWYKKGEKQRFEISGAAGTGKSTVASQIVETLGLSKSEVMYVAPTGKAAQVLRMKGCESASTIHSAIYDYEPILKRDENGNPIKSNGRYIMIPHFRLKDSLSPHIKLIIVDEGSMVQSNIGRDLESFNIPILVLGDLQQLPPVASCDYFLKSPDHVLTEIMRQAEGNPIIYLSQLASKGKPIPYGKYGESCYVIPPDSVSDNMLSSADTILCGRNKTRQIMNQYVRQNIKKIDKKLPVIGDKVICRNNNRDVSIENGSIILTNGLSGTVEGVNLESYTGAKIEIDFKPDFTDSIFEKVDIDFKHLFAPIGDGTGGRSYYNKFEFGYALTVHLSQGSQYNNVLFYSEKMGGRDYYNRLMYTGITRAINGLILVKEDEY